MRISNKKYLYIAASLIGIVIVLVARIGLFCLSTNILMQVNENNDNIFFNVVVFSITVLLLVALGLIGLTIKAVSREPIEELYVLLKRFKDRGGFTGHSSSEVDEITVALEETMNDLHGLLQSILIKAQTIDGRVEILANGIQQVVADQTNLFSLNAAIESARSRQDGFSVVSGEVLSLVERTGRLTGDVRDMADQLRMGVNEIVVELDHVLKRVDPNRISAPIDTDACASSIQGEEAITALNEADGSK